MLISKFLLLNVVLLSAKVTDCSKISHAKLKAGQHAELNQ